MKKITYFILCLFGFSGCIEPFVANSVKIGNILVVEGFITTGTTQINLSKTVPIDEWLYEDLVNVDDAMVYVECDDGSRTSSVYSSGDGMYLIATGELKENVKYRLVIFSKGEEYHSSFISPAISPPVEINIYNDSTYSTYYNVCVTAYGYENQPRYYLWSYKEDWEITAYLQGNYAVIDGDTVINDIYSPNNRYYCWQKDSSKVLILGNTETLRENSIIDKRLNYFTIYNDRISELYRFQVKQNTIHKEAYDFFYNLQKNIDQTGSIFGAIPSEIEGNIRCVSNPDLYVIGYVDVSTTTTDEQYLNAQTFYDMTSTNVYKVNCTNNIVETNEKMFFSDYILYQIAMVPGKNPVIPDTVYRYINQSCVDCTRRTNGATKKRPKDWQNNHY